MKTYEFVSLVSEAPAIAGDGYRVQAPRPALVIGQYELSIQASEYHYCQPRESGHPFGKYTHYEVAIIKDGHLIDPHAEWRRRNPRWMSFFEEPPSPVASFVPAAEVQNILNFLRKVSR